MSFHWCDNIHTTVFTPRDYQVELLAAAYEGNTMICLGHKSSKEFIALKLLQEQAKDMRTTKKVCIYLSCNEAQSMHTMIRHLTDLKVYQQKQDNEKSETSHRLPQDYEVYIMEPAYLFNLLKNRDMSLSHVQLLVLEDCHEAYVYQELLPIFKEFYCSSDGGVSEMPKILGLAGPLHSASCDLQELSAMLSALEENVCCRTETASDIVTVLRYCSKPIEYIVQCAPYSKNELTAAMEDIICTRIAFLNDHRYDPTEIYNTDEFLEELKDIPDPKKEPLDFLNTILEVLHEMGPWAADRVAFIMFHRIEKQKIKTPHERHYILLCLVNTALFEIRALCEQAFSKYTDHKKLIEQYSSPKILRLLEIFRLFKPEEVLTENEAMKKINQDLDDMDFQKLTRSLEYSCQSVENIVKQQIESRSIVENLDPIIQHQQTTTSINNMQTVKEVPQSSANKSVNDFQNPNVNATKNKHNRRSNQLRPKRRTGFQRRQNRDNSGDPTDICALIFCNQNHTARVLFDLLAEMSHHDPDLKFLKCQFTTDRVADPLTEPKEAEQEHRRQEEVLKRFRMHDSNVLIGTAVLEEGIDLPKCNLVVRWDLPKTYRSYVQCKGRARAVPAYHIILVAPKRYVETHSLGRINEQLSDRSHSFLCQNECMVDGTAQDAQSESDSDEDDDDDDDDDSDVITLNDKALSKQLKKFTIGSAKGIVKILNPEVITNKPPTVSEIILKEIKDETLAIEDTKISLSKTEDSNTACNLNDSNLSTVSVASTVSTKSVTRDKKYLGECFEVIDLNESIADISDKMNDCVKPSKSSKKSKELKVKSPVENIKQTPADISVEDHLETYGLKQEEVIKTNSQEQERPKFNTYIETLKMQIAKDNSTEEDQNCMVQTTNNIVDQLAQYREIEKMLLQKCGNSEPAESEHYVADEFTHCIKAYKPNEDLLTGASVDLSSAITLVNKYCSKLPSDTFTKLTPLWRTAKIMQNGFEMFQCTLRLPINSPLKYDIVGLLMPTEPLARRMVALQTCRELHLCGELDDNLQPIGKEGFKAIEDDWENFELEAKDEKIVKDNLEPRPGTTKRRQYYYKRIASEFCDCRPTAGTPCYLYFLDLTLQCPIPEEQNTRGRKIYPPEDAQQGFGILTLKKIPKVSSFPIFTRSGEVKVSIRLSREMVVLTEQQILCINTFLNYTFTNVLRLQKFLMIFDPDSTENCVFIVPTTKPVNINEATDNVNRFIDWAFLDLIEKNSTMMPTPVPEEVRSTQEFEACKFKDAVVMPWYRNQDQPQYFYVAEICPQLSPLSCFPGENYKTFKHYYLLKYNIHIQNTKQPLLDVDHTSARLNFLTPRYVNRKGVALPTSSEETKRAKRENLEQKQILVPELCTVHPFPASLWRTAVCLPCILYRINGLLLADDIRKKVSHDIGLGQQEINEDFDWPMLDFGWSLSEVLRKSRESAMKTTNKAREDVVIENGQKEEIIQEKVEPKVEKREPFIKKPEKSANEIILEGEKQLKDSSFIIGTWSNDFPNDIHEKSKSESINDDDTQYDDDEDEEYLKYVPSNVSFCVDLLENQPKRYASPTFWDFKTTKSNMGSTSNLNSRTGSDSERDSLSASYYDSDSDMASLYGDGFELDDEEEIGPLRRISFKSRNDAETIETEQDIEKRKKQLSIIQDTTENERSYQRTKNMQVGYNFVDLANHNQGELKNSIAKFKASTEQLKKHIKNSGMLIEYNAALTLPKQNRIKEEKVFNDIILDKFLTLLPYSQRTDIERLLHARGDALTIEDIHELNSEFLKEHPQELLTIIGCGDIFDRFNDKTNLVIKSDQRRCLKQISLDFKCRNNAIAHSQLHDNKTNRIPIELNTDKISNRFSFDQQPDLMGHPGPSPSIILQALTMSNANDGINLERLETVGDSFLKYAITTYLYITYDNVHEGKLSHLRSKQVANLNLYRLGRRKMLGEYMIATKFEPHDNWLPPCYYVPKELEKALIEAKIPPHYWKLVDLPNIRKLSNEEICNLVREKGDALGLQPDKFSKQTVVWKDDNSVDESEPDFTWFIPYNLVTQHSIPDKSVADCVEALIGAYLIECGSRGALLFMAWLGIRVLPYVRKPYDPNEIRQPGSTNPDAHNMITVFGEWTAPISPLLHYSPNANEELEILLTGFDKFEATLGYKFRDRSYLLQAMTHASYSPNRLTDCYQRLEFLGDAVLDYLITRHLYEDPRQHSPGALTDLRSALVNNTIFASLAVRHGFHKYFRHLSPGLNEVIDRFVRIQNENGHSISEEFYLLSEEECDDAEDVEVPKALGDVFESVAGAIFLDSNMSLDVVWQVYSNMMKPEIEQFSNSVPKSPIRELLELEPETAKFGKPEKLADGRRVRVTVDVFWKGTFRGVGRNYRIAKCTAAKCALRQLKKKI